MGQSVSNAVSGGKRLRADCGERGCWSAVLYPKVAPEWYRKLISGAGSGDVHLQPPPAGSLLLLGGVNLVVPEEERGVIYWTGGIGAGRSIHEETGRELRLNIGPSQVRLDVQPGAQAQSWPGEVHIWVEDIRTTTDMFNMAANALHSPGIVGEYKKAETGGEFMLKLKGPHGTDDAPYTKGYWCVSEAPGGWPERLRAIGHDPSTSDTTLNPLAIVDATVLVPRRAVLEGVCRFYQHYLLADMRPPGPTSYHAQVHFAPGAGLHQTLTYREDPGAPPYSNIGSLTLYMGDHSKFIRAFARCKQGGILCDPEVDARGTHEFRVRGCQDPQSCSMMVPMVHVVRFSAHPDCPLEPAT